jgi:galactoside O-acetyltransferase
MFLTRDELLQKCFLHVGDNVKISDKASIYGAEKIRIGDNVRIDDFCILSAGSYINIGNNVHIACYTSLIGKGSIWLNDYSGLSMRCTVLSSSDDYSGNFMANPQVPAEKRKVHEAMVYFGKYSLAGAGTVIMPGVRLGDGAVAGAMSFVKTSIPEWEIWAGVPAKYLKNRSKEMLKLL